MSLCLTAVLPVVLLVAPSEALIEFAGVTPPPEVLALNLDPISLPLTDDIWDVLLRVGYASAAASLLVPFGVVVHRYRASAGDRRLQMRWLVWAALVDLFAVVLPLTFPDPFAGLSLSIAVAVTAAAIVVAVTRYRLYDIDRLLSATVVYGLLAVLVVAVDLAVFAVAGTLIGERDAALVAIAVVAVVYTPLPCATVGGACDDSSRIARRPVRGGVDAGQPARSSRPPTGQLAATATSLAGPPSDCRTCASSWPRTAGDTVDGGARDAERREVVLPVTYQGEQAGRLVLCSAGEASLSDRDQQSCSVTWCASPGGRCPSQQS